MALITEVSMNTETVKVTESIVVEEVFVNGMLVDERASETFEIETGHDGAEVEISIELYNDAEHQRKHFRAAKTALLLEILDEGARKLGVKLLPDPQAPLDVLRAVYRDHAAGAPLNLDLTLAEFLKQEPVTHHFAVDLVLAIQINTRWRVAPKEDMTPKAILELADLPPAEYSLYYPCDSVEPLPPDVPVKLHRGQRFEAQRDGKYGHGGCD